MNFRQLLCSRSCTYSIVFTLLALFLVELALQIRSEMRYGVSIFSSIFADSEKGSAKSGLYQKKAEYVILSPNVTMNAGQISIVTNSLGLRGREYDFDNKELKNIVVLGASTVYGAFATSYEKTFTHLLEVLLNSESPILQYQVINAGIPGNNIAKQTALYKDIFAQRNIHALVVYPGLLNMLAPACYRKNNRESHSLIEFELPKWLLTVDLLLKNTTGLRYNKLDELTKTPVNTSAQEDELRKGLASLVDLAHKSGVEKVFLVENLKSFNESQPIELQKQLASTTLYYASCYTLSDVNETFNRFNAVMKTFALESEYVDYVSVEDPVFLDRKSFADSIHFSEKGEIAMASTLRKALDNYLGEISSE